MRDRPPSFGFGPWTKIVARDVEDEWIPFFIQIEIVNINQLLFGLIIVNQGGIDRLGQGNTHRLATDVAPGGSGIVRAQIIEVGALIDVSAGVHVESRYH